MASPSREELVDLAKLAEQEERFEEMVESIICIAKMGKGLSLEERNLFSRGYKNLLGAKCARERVQTAINLKEDTDAGKEQCPKAEAVKVFCKKMIETTDQYLLTTVSNPECSVFYNTMKGDRHQYLAKFKHGAEKRKVLDQTLSAYQTATKTAEKSLPPTNEVRLHLSIRMSAFYYEMESSPTIAYHVTKQAFDEAISVMDSLHKEEYQNCMELMKVLRDNLRLWRLELDVGTDHNLEGTLMSSISKMPRVHCKMTPEPMGGFKGKVIYMSSRMPVIATADLERPKEQDQPSEPLFSYDYEKNKIQEEVLKVKSKLGPANDELVLLVLLISWTERVPGKELWSSTTVDSPLCSVFIK